MQYFIGTQKYENQILLFAFVITKLTIIRLFKIIFVKYRLLHGYWWLSQKFIVILSLDKKIRNE